MFDYAEKVKARLKQILGANLSEWIRKNTKPILYEIPRDSLKVMQHRVIDRFNTGFMITREYEFFIDSEKNVYIQVTTAKLNFDNTRENQNERKFIIKEGL